MAFRPVKLPSTQAACNNPHTHKSNTHILNKKAMLASFKVIICNKVMNKEILRIRAEKAAAITFAVIIGAVSLKSCGELSSEKDSSCHIEMSKPAS